MGSTVTRFDIIERGNLNISKETASRRLKDANLHSRIT